MNENGHKFLIPIAGLFSATLLMSNILDTKIFEFMGLNLPAGIIVFPLAYLFGDILTEVYGYSKARQVIWTGFASLLLLVFVTEIARALPPSSFYKNEEAFDLILGHVPRLIAASLTAYIVGEFVNSFIVAKMKVAMGGNNMALRFFVSTLFGQLCDTVVFVLVAFAGVFGFSDMVSLIISGWLIKVAWEVIALPITVNVVNYIKEKENIDHFDNNTSFSPFSLK